MSLPRPVPRLAGFFQGRGRGEALAYGLSRSPGSGECRVCIMFLTRKTITQRGGNHPNRRRQKPTGEGGGVGTAGEGGTAQDVPPSHATCHDPPVYPLKSLEALGLRAPTRCTFGVFQVFHVVLLCLACSSLWCLSVRRWGKRGEARTRRFPMPQKHPFVLKFCHS